ncbi:ABC transporter permease [Paenibacillus tengchongensis]|uniref:ABC transporter permease n=1 Tax=Paenibacillus tengchongensis TaxID=2608684 RepID=UPI00124C3408|nr:ABC-2 family transporter protein [Paenibacillus tengchongensis]
MGTWNALFATRFKTVMVFRAAALSGIVAQIFFAFFKIFTLYGFMEGGTENSPLHPDSVVVYIWLTQIFLTIIPWNVNGEDLYSIRSGNIAYELVRPVNLFALMYIKTISWRVTNSLIRVIPIVIFNMILLPILGFGEFAITIPSGKILLLFIISITIAYLLSCMITVFLYSITLYTIDASNFLGIINSMALVLSGTIIPLSYFPESLQVLLILQPFKGIIDTPALILTGQYTYSESMLYILLQLVWLLIFFLLNSVMFKKGTKKIVVQGG